MLTCSNRQKDCECFDHRLLRARKMQEYRDRIKREGRPEKQLTHGLRCYWRGCRNTVCRRAAARYQREWRGTQLQPVKHVKSIVNASTANGLASRTGLSPATILNIKRGQTKRIQQSTGRKILNAGEINVPREPRSYGVSNIYSCGEAA